MEELLLFIDNPKDPIYHHFDSLEINTDKLDVINEKVKELIHNKDLQTSEAKDWLIKCRDVLVFDFKPYFQKWSPWGFADILKDEALEKVERTIERVEYAIKHFIEPSERGTSSNQQTNITASEQSIKKDYAALLVYLNEYIQGMDKTAFNYIINNKKRLPGAAKGVWIGSKVEARVLADHFGMDESTFNKGFVGKDGKPIHIRKSHVMDKDYQIKRIIEAFEKS